MLAPTAIAAQRTTARVSHCSSSQLTTATTTRSARFNASEQVDLARLWELSRLGREDHRSAAGGAQDRWEFYRNHTHADADPHADWHVCDRGVCPSMSKLSSEGSSGATHSATQLSSQVVSLCLIIPHPTNKQTGDYNGLQGHFFSQ